MQIVSVSCLPRERKLVRTKRLLKMVWIYREKRKLSNFHFPLSNLVSTLLVDHHISFITLLHNSYTAMADRTSATSTFSNREKQSLTPDTRQCHRYLEKQQHLQQDQTEQVTGGVHPPARVRNRRENPCIWIQVLQATPLHLLHWAQDQRGRQLKVKAVKA